MSSMTADDPMMYRGYALHRQLCDSLGVALVATDSALVIRLWNGAAGRMFGAGADRMIGTPVTSIMPEGRRSLADRVLQRVIRSGEVVDFEFQYRDVHGERRELVVTIAPVTSEPGVRVGASLCFRDITRRITLQNELSESRKLSALGAMAGAIAHHFNNILGGIITSVDFAKRSNDPTMTSKVLVQTERSLIRAATLVNGLLAFSEGGRYSEDLADLTEVIYEIADEIEGRNADPKIEFTLIMDSNPVLPVARVQVQTILRNIVQNAIESMPHGGQLRMSVALEDERILIEVTDSGCGMDEAARARLFEPFWTTKGKLSDCGSQVKGLGLSIAYGLVQVLGGSIAVTSEVNQGSTFKVSLPRPHAT